MKLAPWFSVPDVVDNNEDGLTKTRKKNAIILHRKGFSFYISSNCNHEEIRIRL